MALIIFALLFGVQANGSPSEAEPPRQKICRASVQETGSHIRTGRRCKTAEEWRRLDERQGQVSPSARITAGQGDAMTNQKPPH